MLQFSRGEPNELVSERDIRFIESQLGREPRGLEAIPVRATSGDPAVICVASIVDGKPFPTLFWLVDPALNYQIDQMEAGGLIARLQREVDASPALQAGMARDHRDYIDLRESYYTPRVREILDKEFFQLSMRRKGIGGIGSFHRIRCLHTWYAAHLVRPNTIGRLLERIDSEAG